MWEKSPTLKLLFYFTNKIIDFYIKSKYIFKQLNVNSTSAVNQAFCETMKWKISPGSQEVLFSLPSLCRSCCPFFFFSFFPESCVVSLRKLHVTQNVLDWCKHNSDFCIVDICHLILEYILKCFVVHHFNSYCSLCFFVGWDLLLAVYFIFLLRSGNDVRKFK